MKFLFSIYALLLSLAVTAADNSILVDPPIDYSKADVDGPHVFFKRGEITVKSLVRRDSGLVLKTKLYKERSEILLTCHVGKDHFSFPLQQVLEPSPEQYDMPERLFVTSDIEGNFAGFKMLLQSASVIDTDFRWSYGNGHLVLLGDFFDRGLNVTECLWLIYKLEQEAVAAGGKVHFILGNHEVMNLCGETQYVRKKYFENARLFEVPYESCYSKDTELGRWLRTKNAVEKIGETLFCHGGMSPELAEYRMTLKDINKLARRYYGVPNDRIGDSYAAAIFDGEKGIFWSRCVAKNILTVSDVIQILYRAGANSMVVAHTLVPDITPLYEGKVICIDLYHEENTRQGFMKGLCFKQGQPFVFRTDGASYTPLVLSTTSPTTQR
jgi:Calcineurin-like phosphoesterase